MSQLQDNLFLTIARGLVPGAISVSKFGRNPDIDIGTEDIWGGGGMWTAPTSAGTVNFASSSAADAAAGTGARTISINGLDQNYNDVTETLILNGVTNVATVNSYFIIHRVIVLTAGSGATNAGTITGTSTGGGTPVMITIQIGKGQTQFCIYQIPAGYTGYLQKYGGSMNGAIALNAAANLLLELFAKPLGGVFNLKGSLYMCEVGSNNAFREYHSQIKFIEKTTIKITGTADTNNTDVVGFFDLILIAN